MREKILQAKNCSYLCYKIAPLAFLTLQLPFHVFLVNYSLYSYNTGCPTPYRTRHFFNNSNTNEDIETKFEQQYVRCVRNEKECVCSVCL
jgi:hypothetical protein